MKKQISRIIFLGAFLVLAGLVLLVQPYYTMAVVENDDHPCRIALDPWDLLFELGNLNPGDSIERSITVTKVGKASANLFLTWDWVDGEPVLGEPGSLFEQLVLVIRCEGRELYRGPMSEGYVTGEVPAKADALNISQLLGRVMAYGDVLRLDFMVLLPGAETGNEFQGSTLTTELVFYTICSNEIIIPPEPPSVDPPVIIIPPQKPKQNPPLPRTRGLSIAILICGLVLLGTGLVLRRRLSTAE
ncbi:MAG: hypothetical protein AB1767_07165 [Bacillota bacterium]